MPYADGGNKSFGATILKFAQLVNDSQPPFDKLVADVARSNPVAFMSYCEIKVNENISPIAFAERHDMKTSQLHGSFRCRLLLGTDILGRRYRALHRQGDARAQPVQGKYHEAGLLPVVMNLLTLGFAKRIPWAEPRWIETLQSLQVSTADEFERTVKADFADRFGGYIMGRE